MNKDNCEINEPKASKNRHGCFVWLIGGYFFLIVAMNLLFSILFALRYEPLPSDEKMISYFQAHREEFETLTKNYKAFIPTTETPIFEVLPENRTMIKNAAIKRIQGLGPSWFSNPYSPEAAKTFETNRKQAGANSVEFTMEDQPLGRSHRKEVLLLAGIHQLFTFNSHSLWDFFWVIFGFNFDVEKQYIRPLHNQSSAIKFSNLPKARRSVR